MNIIYIIIIIILKKIILKNFKYNKKFNNIIYAEFLA